MDELPALRTMTFIIGHPPLRPPAMAAASCAWMAVMATVLTMSVTVQPRLRSLTGLFRPCRTGPMATAPALRCTAL